jgi:HPt (histidine-containing phosphotransfer) domain-containing protein
MGDEELVKEIAKDFLDDAPKQLALLGEAAARGDASGAGKRAHSIKGACGNVGAMAMSGVAAKVETAGQAGLMEEVNSLLPELERQFAAVRERMEELLRRAS